MVLANVEGILNVAVLSQLVNNCDWQGCNQFTCWAVRQPKLRGWVGVRDATVFFCLAVAVWPALDLAGGGGGGVHTARGGSPH